MTAYETVSAGSKGAANLLEHQKHCFRHRQLTPSVKSFTIGPYKLLMKKVMKSLSIGYMFQSIHFSSQYSSQV